MFKCLGSVAIWAMINLCVSLPALTYAQSTGNNSALITEQSTAQVTESPLTQLGNKYHNGIQLLQNRFRIDYEVDEITMIFFREYGSLPIVLVRPDGSKIFQGNANGEDVFWFDTATYDMVSLKNPTPGPWQAVGQIIPNSRVMVISDLELHAEPLPNIIFSGEILKQTAYLTNDGVPIDYTAFRDVVELTTSLSSTNNPNFNNFGANTEVVATFIDNGKGMDERPLDGVFTGQFNLAIADGEWIPTFTVSTPMFSREQVDPNIMLLANPIKISVEIDGGGDGYHKLNVDAEREHVDMSTLLIDGKVRFPNGDIQNFSITEMSSDIREYLIVNYEYGVYRVKLTTYGTTNDGREFILDVPEYSFLTEEPEPVIVEKVTTPSNAALNGTEPQSSKSDIIEPQIKEGMSSSTLVGIIIIINLVILIFGGGLIWWFTRDKKAQFKLDKNTKDPSTDLSQEKPKGWLKKMFKSKTKAIPEVTDKKTAAKTESDTGFKDLSLPKE